MLDKPARDEALGPAGRIHAVKAHNSAIYRSVNTPSIDVEQNAFDTNRLVRLSCDGSAMQKHHVQHDYRQRQQANCVDFSHGYRPF
jgi:hypothetical protein